MLSGAVKFGLIAAAAAGLAALAGCNRSEPASASASGASDQAYAAENHRRGGGGGGYDDGARPPVPLFHGEPMWSESRRYGAEESAEYHFKRDGRDLGAKTLDDFLTKVHHFGDHPPPGALTLTRANGDKLLYDPKSNLFGVFTRDGAPRTVFKPREGMSYWNEQKQREAQGGDYHSRGYGQAGGYGGGYGRSDPAAGSGGSEPN